MWFCAKNQFQAFILKISYIQNICDLDLVWQIQLISIKGFKCRILGISESQNHIVYFGYEELNNNNKDEHLQIYEVCVEKIDLMVPKIIKYVF